MVGAGTGWGAGRSGWAACGAAGGGGGGGGALLRLGSPSSGAAAGGCTFGLTGCVLAATSGCAGMTVGGCCGCCCCTEGCGVPSCGCGACMNSAFCGACMGASREPGAVRLPARVPMYVCSTCVSTNKVVRESQPLLSTAMCWPTMRQRSSSDRCSICDEHGGWRRVRAKVLTLQRAVPLSCYSSLGANVRLQHLCDEHGGWQRVRACVLIGTKRALIAKARCMLVPAHS